jgi:hypothetical protein
MKTFIAARLKFPSEKDIELLDDQYLKEFFQLYFNAAHDIFLDDNYDGRDDGLVEFKVSYNDFHKCYDISLIGGTKYKEKTEKLMAVLKKDYQVDKPTTTWKWVDKIKHNGLRFFVNKKDLRRK